MVIIREYCYIEERVLQSGFGLHTRSIFYCIGNFYDFPVKDAFVGLASGKFGIRQTYYLPERLSSFREFLLPRELIVSSLAYRIKNP